MRDYQPPTAVQHTVVLLHGLCLTYTSWHNQIRRLQRQPGVRIIAYDHRGHGHSTTAPLRTYTIEQLAGDLADVLTDLAVTGPVTLAGHSMGGMCALAYLARANQPVAPTGLVLIATNTYRSVMSSRTSARANGESRWCDMTTFLGLMRSGSTATYCRSSKANSTLPPCLGALVHGLRHTFATELANADVSV